MFGIFGKGIKSILSVVFGAAGLISIVIAVISSGYALIASAVLAVLGIVFSKLAKGGILGILALPGSIVSALSLIATVIVGGVTIYAINSFGLPFDAMRLSILDIFRIRFGF